MMKLLPLSTQWQTIDRKHVGSKKANREIRFTEQKYKKPDF